MQDVVLDLKNAKLDMNMMCLTCHMNSNDLNLRKKCKFGMMMWLRNAKLEVDVILNL